MDKFFIIINILITAAIATLVSYGYNEGLELGRGAGRPGMEASPFQRTGSDVYVRNSSDEVAVGTTTARSVFNVEDGDHPTTGAAATTTMDFGTSTTTARTCINARNAEGVEVNYYIDGNNAWVIGAGRCA